jgi:flagellin-like hook-associated protein FlgL
MSDSIRAGDYRVCPACGSRNKAAHNFCVRCSASLEATAPAATRLTAASRPRTTRPMRFVVAVGVLLAIGAAFALYTVSRATQEVAVLSEGVRADSGETAAVPAPPPPVSGWYPGANVPVEPDTAPSWSSSSFPVARPNPYDVPGDPSASMVGIAPRAPRSRAAMLRQRVFTDQDLLATRESHWSTPAPEPARPQARPDAERSDEVAEREAKVNAALSRLDAAQERLSALRARAVGANHDALEDAAEDVDDAQRAAAKATRKLEDARREN